ncbi:ABC transporter ATP-binding protein [SAR86 cluster bacterium]|nr:ABC transporter [Gammaproteobacteria bacterium]URQ70299.1 ABC transporter ATP-binding protein [SAR86 cluster bacterium]URQ71654.1 ABC transporter ATP-binding protein [SAR86 cluster bacterium]GIS26742.1 MAG: ABC transporter ATP-binding protein [Gammaproteobacteria bacterium]|tara:strand:+ start:16251 stop:17168 length:918 start_codon:yes stop_codon:yes gene_type:complete
MTDLALEIQALEKEYASGVKALKGINLSVTKGDFFALLGPNGAGKSSTIGIISSLVTKTSGTVKIFGIDIDRDFNEAKRQIGVVAQEINFSPFEKVRDIVLTQAGYYGLSKREAILRGDKVLKSLGLWDKRDEQSRNLSGGLKRRLMIAKAMIHEPKLLILDEPTAGVDIELRRGMWDLISKLNDDGTTIILTTHYLEEAEQLCRNIAIIDHGEIVENTSMKELLAKLDVQSFVIDLEHPIESAPELSHFTFKLQDPSTLIVAIDKQQTMNNLFTELNKLNISVKSMRNESNRLEELFMNVIKDE